MKALRCLGWVAALLAAVLVMKCRGQDGGKPEKPPQERHFNSRLPFHVFVQILENELPREVGTTPAEKPLTIPPCYSWWVEPIGKPNMPAIGREIEEQKIPGLCLLAESKADFPDLKGLGTLELLILQGPGVTDAALANLTALKALQKLYLEGTEVTGLGLAQLKDLKELRILRLWGSKMTDAGMVHLKVLTTLKKLDLSCCTQVTDAGLANLKGLTSLQTLNLRETQVTDAGLTHLKDLKALQTLNLENTQVTDAGVAELRKALPDLKVSQ
jgi:Leucine-rich repeat (LRR) protein